MFSLTFQKSLQTLIFLLRLYASSSQKTLPLDLCATVFIQTQRSDVYGTSHDKILPQSKLLFVKTFKYALKLNIYMMFFLGITCSVYVFQMYNYYHNVSKRKSLEYARMGWPLLHPSGSDWLVVLFVCSLCYWRFRPLESRLGKEQGYVMQ